MAGQSERPLKRKPSAARTVVRQTAVRRVLRPHHWAALLYPPLCAVLLDERYAAAVGFLTVLLFALYGWDKRSARNGGRRVPENTLHLLALLGGWPGAWLARPFFRHKTAKQPFCALFYLTVAANIAVLCWAAYSGGMPDWTADWRRGF